MRVFDVCAYGAIGDGKALDTAAIQQAVNEAAQAAQGSKGATRPRVLLRGGKSYRSGTVELKSGIDFHLADDAQLLVSTNRQDYAAHADVQAEGSGGGEAVLVAEGAVGLSISGTGSINGQAEAFMDHYDQPHEWWIPRGFRPRLMVLTDCRDLEIRNITLRQAPFWTLHLLGCRQTLVNGVKVRNRMDVPNCDGIAPDHCRDLEISNCDIVCGDDAIVIKATRTLRDYGESARITVKDCTLETQDCGLKIGTETTRDIHDVRFQRCRIKSSCRGIGILLRDEASVYNVHYRDIEFVSRYHSDPWWGRGEAISLTAIPRLAGGSIGTIHHVRFDNVRGRSENSARIEGSSASAIRDVEFNDVSVTLDRWTAYRGGVFDNRPTTSQQAIEPHDTAGFCVRHALNVMLRNCSVAWGKNIPPYFSNALHARHVTGLTHPGFQGSGARAGVDAMDIVQTHPPEDCT